MCWHHERYRLTFKSYCAWISFFCNTALSPLTSAFWIHSNVYGLDNIHCIRYLTAVDSFHSTSSAVHNYHHLTSASVEIPLPTCTGNTSSIGEVPASYGATSKRRSTTSSLVSYAEQSITTITNILQPHDTVVLVCCISEWEPDITCTWEGKIQCDYA